VLESAVGADRLPDPADTAAVEDDASHSGADDVASDRSSLLFLLLLLLLLPGQHQKLHVAGQHFSNHLLKLSSGAYPAADLLSPRRGDAFYVALPVDHVRQGPSRMPLGPRTTTGSFTASRIAQGQGSGQLLGQQGEMTDGCKLALTQARGLCGPWLFPHLVAIVLQVQRKSKHLCWNAKIGRIPLRTTLPLEISDLQGLIRAANMRLPKRLRQDYHRWISFSDCDSSGLFRISLWHIHDFLIRD